MGLTILILLLPVIFLVAAFWQGLYAELSRFGIFLGILPLILQQFPKTLGFTGALVVSLLGVELCYNKISLFLRKPCYGGN